jgi:hypothetical protein
MPTTNITLIKGDTKSSGDDFLKTDYRDNIPINMYAVDRPILGAQGYMTMFPGIESYSTGFGRDRGGVYNERFDLHFRVSGEKFISIDSEGVVTELGTVPGTSQASMPFSFLTQAVIADGNMFLYDPVGGFRQITDPDLGNPLDGDWINGYYFLTDGENIYHTELANEEAIDPLKFATAEFLPDPSIGISRTSDNKIIVWGRYSKEDFIDQATTNFAFKRIETRAMKIGIVSTHAKAETDNRFFIVGSSKNEDISIYSIGLGSVEKIATHTIDKIIAKYTEDELLNIRVEARKDADEKFVIFHFLEEVLCFNLEIAKTNGIEYAWSIIKTDVEGENPWRAINGVFDRRNANWVYGDKIDSRIGILDDNICTQYGELIEHILYTPFINMESYSIDRIEIDTIPGQTNINDATLAVSLTYDGQTFSKEYWELYGEPYDYNKRFIKRSLGYVRYWVGFKFRSACQSRMAFGLMKLEYN